MRRRFSERSVCTPGLLRVQRSVESGASDYQHMVQRETYAKKDGVAREAVSAKRQRPPWRLPAH